MVDSRKLIPESSWLNHFVIGGILLAGIQVGIKTQQNLGIRHCAILDDIKKRLVNLGRQLR